MPLFPSTLLPLRGLTLRLRNIIASLFLCSSALIAQNCTGTPNTGAPLSLAQPNAHCTQWNVQMNSNFGAINQFAATTVSTNPSASQTVTQPDFTYLNLNSILLFGATPYVAFGQSVNSPSGFLTEISPGNYTLDTAVAGNRSGSLALQAIDASFGYTVAGGAPAGTILCSSGGHYVPCSSLPSGLISGYQTVQSSGTSLTQRSILDFGSSFATTDDSANARTHVSLGSTGVTPGSYTYASISVAADGRISAAASGPPPGGFDLYWTVTNACVIGVGQPNHCDFHTSLPGNLPDANYQLFCTLNFKSDTPAGACNIAQNGLPISSGGDILVRIGQYQQNSTTGTAAPDVYMHAHHN